MLVIFNYYYILVCSVDQIDILWFLFSIMQSVSNNISRVQICNLVKVRCAPDMRLKIDHIFNLLLSIYLVDRLIWIVEVKFEPGNSKNSKRILNFQVE